MKERSKKPFFIIVSGPSGSGKTTVSNSIINSLPKNVKAAIVSQDDFYNEKNKIPKNKKNGMLNFDHPNAFNWKLIRKTLNEILFNNCDVYINKYDFSLSKASSELQKIPKNIHVVIFEGLFSLYDKDIVDLANLTVFVDTQLDECIIRRIERDIHERGRNIDNVIEHWREIVKPMYKLYVEPLKYNVDVIIPWDEGKTNSIKLITNGIKI